MQYPYNNNNNNNDTGTCRHPKHTRNAATTTHQSTQSNLYLSIYVPINPLDTFP